MLRTFAPSGRIAEPLLGLIGPSTEMILPPVEAEPGLMGPQSLTGREHQVLGLVAEGYSNKLIALQLAISERTVKSHLTNIMTKLRAADRTHAVVTAIRLGWLVI